MNARRIALALQYVRDHYIDTTYDSTYKPTPDGRHMFLVEPGTVVSDNAETNDPTVECKDDDAVFMFYEDGTRYRISVTLLP